MSRPVSWLLFVAIAVPATGCLRASAKTVKDVPLDMPPPPPRVVETVEATPVAPAPLIEEPAHEPIRLPARSIPRADAARPEPPKSESPKAEGSTEATRAAEEAAKPPTSLQTTPPSAELEVERTIRGVIYRAAADLSRVDYRVLNTDGRSQYDTAKRFIRQAEDALDPRTRNLLYARNLADKALALAGQLAKR
ncbi:MAG: hypothetical protein C5B57_00280 [Blastocatellia bacterium]|nr:MAG: hypothetical protein C5B57_00280 [Blastocatellia bacterium]